MPDVPFAGEIIKEMKARPYTMIVVLALAAAVPYTMLNYAKAQDVDALTKQVATIDASIKRAALEAQIRSISTELFGLKQKVADKQDAHQHVDSIYLARIAQLEADKAQAERELEAMSK